MIYHNQFIHRNVFVCFFILSTYLHAQSMKDLVVDSSVDAKAHREKVIDFKTNVAKLNAKLVYENAQKSLNSKNYIDALHNYDLLVRANPQNPTYLYEKGVCNLLYQNYNGAIADLNSSIALNPSNTTAYIKRAKAKSMVGDYNGAIQDTKKYLETQKNSSESYSIIAYSQLKLGNLDEAYSNAEKSLSLNPNNLDAIETRAYIYFKQKNYAKALEDFNKMLTDISRQSGVLYFNRAMANFNTQKFENACSDWKKAKELGVPNAEKYIVKYCN
ncbi:MAG: tetratricopeptide repeat protein [Flavobacteriales bacterium]|nr:tetratricopeptide repeat protein [Flavobacteriales bacterium]